MKKILQHKLLFSIFLLTCLTAVCAVVFLQTRKGFASAANRPYSIHKQAWEVSESFSGDGNQTTKLFAMKGSWRILWSCEEGRKFMLTLRSPETSDIQVANVFCLGDNSAGVSTLDFTDDAYLTIVADGKWNVDVEETNRQ